ncbi:amino acid--[acyl-carrier-protein] ligase [Humibacter sp.]|uniref:amino acid--[acyl-carrier-protein] ligase n=1 Tax=Humibacter sp. TaxID=1940291 RepID=UPI003F7DEFD0
MGRPAQGPDEERAAFRAELLASGLLVHGGVDGLYQRSGAFERVVRGVEALASRAGHGRGGPQLFFPPIMAKDAFERTDYLRSFPDLAGAVEVFNGGDAEHAELLLALEQGRNWTDLLVPSEVALSSAACHPLYATLAGTLPAGGSHYEVQGYCFRHEPSIDPVRMQSFRQHEFVYVGEPESARSHRDAWLERGAELLESLGLDVRVEEANDPFFGRAGRMLAANQRATALKFEITAPVSSDVARTAIASANCHESHFGETFGIRTADGIAAHSACIGFGLERIALALVKRHGTDVERWPAEVREALRA